MVRMHRVIMGLGPDGPKVDHKDGNGLNNQRENLRLASTIQNGQNRRPDKRGSSKYKGVCWKSRRSHWEASIQHNGKRIHLGCFQNELEAARAYDKTALEFFGEFARINLFKL